MAAGQLPSEVGHLSKTEFPPLNSNVSNLSTKFLVAISYISTIVNEAKNSKTIQRKQVVIVDGVPRIKWSKEEELRLNIPKQCDIKGDCQIGLLRNKHILIRLSKQVDFINLISKGTYYIGCKDGYSYRMCTLIYDARFQINEETTKALAWISFPNLLPIYFVKECLYSLASAIWELVQLDLATLNITRTSCASVKVQVDLKSNLPKVVMMDIVDEG
ncbi:hypothetical protein H5410_040321 [Solanum commersonii]|uniref:DUF4283 domain-containing protein n=1 Tax=Solanum commersonii TaxID=4109 RepID=A0A9J5XQL8_SOLCO|nr:hypothetical protein H5410_040321 [Solanum commersonii]